MSVSKYRKKPVVVEAIYLSGTNAGEVVAWINSHGVRAVMRGGSKGGSKGASVGISTLEGVIWYEHGWWIIRGVKGEFYGCRADVFDETYDEEHV